MRLVSYAHMSQSPCCFVNPSDIPLLPASILSQWLISIWASWFVMQINRYVNYPPPATLFIIRLVWMTPSCIDCRLFSGIFIHFFCFDKFACALVSSLSFIHLANLIASSIFGVVIIHGRSSRLIRLHVLVFFVCKSSCWVDFICPISWLTYYANYAFHFWRLLFVSAVWIRSEFSVCVSYLSRLPSDAPHVCQWCYCLPFRQPISRLF